MKQSKNLKRIADYVTGKAPVKWVFAGDSITHGALHTFGHRDYTEHFSERIRFELRRSGDCVIKTATDGGWITTLADDLHGSLLQYQPQVVSLNYGMNDCTAGPEGVKNFATVYRDVLKQVSEKTGATIILHTPTGILPDNRRRVEFLPPYIETIQSLADETDAILVDNTLHWKEAEARGVMPYWLSDAVHPNEYGHRAIAHFLLRELGLFDAKSAVCRLLVP